MTDNTCNSIFANWVNRLLRHRFLWRAIAVVLVMCAVQPAVAMKKQVLDNVKREIARADSLYQRQQYLPALDIYISQIGYPRRAGSDSLYLLLLSRIGTVYDIYEDYGRAFYYYDKVLTDASAAKYDDIYSKVLVKMVVGYYNSNELDKARSYYRQQLAHPIKDKQLSGYYRYTNGGLVEILAGRHEKALGLLRRTLAHCDSMSMEPVFKVPVMLEMAGSFGKLGKPDSVLHYLTMAREISECENLDTYAADCYNALYRYYKNEGDPVSAARYLELYSTMSDSVDMHKKLDTASLRLLQTHDVEAREEINSLNATIDFQAKTLIIFLLFCLALAVFTIYTRRQHRRLKASYRMLIEKSDEIFELEEHTAAQVVSQGVAAQGTTDGDAQEPETDMHEESNPLLERINAALSDVNLISRPSFSLAELSREVGSNTKYVSALINDVYKKNFRTILNERRIREATRRLSDNAQYGECSIADIADSLGYSSSTVFINAFKKVIGMTPAVYRRYRK